jgi:hypothetical protein
VLLLSACQKDDNTAVIFSGKTVLVYMVADNSLNAISTTNIDSMVVGFSRSKTAGQLVIYLDNESGVPSLIQLVKDSNGTVTQRVVKTYAEQNSVDVAVMSGIFSDVMKFFPSTSYGLVLWSHGYGWLPGTTNAKASSLRWFGQDGSYNMDISGLAMALKSDPHFDYVLFDACFIGGVETAYALRSCTDYLISFERQLDKVVVYKASTPNILSMSSDGYTSFFSVNHYSGLNTYIPQSSSPARNVSYLALEWSMTVGWNKTKW